ncbi:MAG: class I SAM-dependent methyltransferase [Chloroflexi bacterium]|nr:class I SAM-dependent methyltransferase [Chloroflexota bacterium]
MTQPLLSDGVVDSESASALVRADHPFMDAQIAKLYDVFPFAADLPLYRRLAAAQGGRVLEIACGSGRVVVPLVEAGNQVVGLDASPHMLDLARAKLRSVEAGAAARLVQGDMRDFDLGETFDLAIIATKSFAYLVDRRDQAQALSCIARHLRPGGLLALDLLHPRPAWLQDPPGTLRQDLTAYAPRLDAIVSRTETMVEIDLARQLRIIRSAYEIVAADGTVTKRFVEWPYRYTYRFEAEHLLERAGFTVKAVLGDYEEQSQFHSDSNVMVFLAHC